MLLSEKGKTSPSFLIAVLVVVVGVVGVIGWRYFRPNPFKQSEYIVRESRVVLSTRVRDFEQEVLDLVQKAGSDPSETLVAIEKHADATKDEIDRYIDEARARLSELDIPLKTHQNRADRLGEKADEAKAIIDDRVEEKREQLSGS
jgi:hypothetical protein